MRHLVLFALILSVSSTGFSSPIGNIQALSDPAFRMPVTSDSFHSVKVKEMIDWGDSLKTGNKGFIGILFKDGSLVKLSGNTEIKIALPEEEDNKRVFNIKFGDLWAKITQSETGTVVRTPSSVASIKGTSFWVMVTPSGDTRLLCNEGIVELLNLISGMMMEVPSGQMCSSGMDGSMEVSSINPETPPQAPPQGQPAQPPPTPPTGGEPTPSPTPAPEPPSGGGGLGFNMNGAVGASTINGVNYQYFSLRPDLSIWKFGVGLDLSFYFDSEGKLREEDWDEAGDLVDKIYYLRFGKPGEPFYVRVGSLAPTTLGYGLIMRRYTNAIEWPQVKRVGLQTQVKLGHFGLEALINNFQEIDTPGLVGGRLTLETKFIFPVVFGGTFVMDGNQFLGAKDDDDDGIPNQWDQFPDKNDGNHIQWLQGLLTQPQIDSLITSGDLPDINNPSPSIADMEDPVSEWGVDVGIPLWRSKLTNFWVYAQMAQIVDYGRGYTVPGVQFNIGPLNLNAEYRIFEKQFMSDFFDMAYETQRVYWEQDLVTMVPGTYHTKESTLTEIPSAQGYFAEANLNVFNYLNLIASYQEMSYDGGLAGKTFFAKAALKTTPIPKLRMAEAYYQQPNAENLFETKSNGTVMGYKVGLAVSESVTLIYDNKTIYYNGEPQKIMTIETAISF